MATIKYRTSSTAPWITLTNVDSTQPSDTLPLMDGVANAGTSDAYARGDHKHPSDTSKANTSLSNLSNNNDALKNLGAQSNPNLLRNWWFANPINQRNKTAYSGYGYVVDGWKILNNNASFEVINGGVRIKSLSADDNGYIHQLLENPYGTAIITISVKTTDGIIHSNLFNVEVSGFLFYTNGNREIGIRTPKDGTSYLDIAAIKLEYGSVSTLTNDHAPNYTEEFIRCISSTADPADTYANKPYTPASNPNLLDNWWFGNGVINQRGVTQFKDGAYGVDRWHSWANVYTTVSDSGITVPVGGQLRQTIEDIEKYNGKTLTLSALDSVGHLYTITGVYNSGSSIWDTTDGVTLIVGTADKIFSVQTQDVARTFIAAKLEYGSVSTLANDHAPDYATELLKCQRYYVRLKSNYNGNGNFICPAYAANEHQLRAVIALPTPMRNVSTNPAVVFHNIVDATANEVTFNYAGWGYSDNLVTMVCNSTKTYAADTLTFLRFGANGYIEFLKDL